MHGYTSVSWKFLIFDWQVAMHNIITKYLVDNNDADRCLLPYVLFEPVYGL